VSRRLLTWKAGLAFAVMIGVAVPVSAQLHVDWADKFNSSRVYVHAQTTDFINIRHFWDGGNYIPRWSRLGIQGIGAPASSNAVERVQFDLQDNGCCVCTNATTSIQRWRITPPPSIGSSCSVGGLQYVGIESYTRNSCAFGVPASYYSHRNRPEFSFVLESGAGLPTNAFTGYRSRVLVQTGTNSDFRDGCFQIYWMP
jgi:hypothetical protein